MKKSIIKTVLVILALATIVFLAYFFMKPLFITNYDYDKQTQTLTITGGKFSSDNEVYQIKGEYADCKNCVIKGKIYVIDAEAFVKCENLEKIEVCDNVTSIEKKTFYGCKRLKNVKLSKNLDTISQACFEDCTSLKNIDLPKNLKNIENRAFACSGLKRIELPKNLKAIRKEAFFNTKLESVLIPKNITSFFDAFDNSVMFDISKENKNYTGKNGIIYNKDKTKLLYYSSSLDEKKFVLPKTVKEVTCILIEKGLEKVYFHKNVSYVEDFEQRYYKSRVVGEKLFYWKKEEWVKENYPYASYVWDINGKPSVYEIYVKSDSKLEKKIKKEGNCVYHTY